MAVSAYAAVLSLMHFLDGIQQYPPEHRLHKVSFLQDRIETLREKVNFLPNFLESYSQRFYEDLQDLARQIAAVSFEAEGIIDTIVVDQLHKGFADKSDMDLSFSCEEEGERRKKKKKVIEVRTEEEGERRKKKKKVIEVRIEDIDNVIEKFDSITKQLMMIKEEVRILEQGPGVSIRARSSAPPLSGNSTVVRFDERLHQIIEKLIRGYEYGLQVLPIVGMGGIGKTTLAKTAFDHSRVSRRFDIRVWLTISQEYNMPRILLGVLEKLADQKTDENLDDENLANEDLAKLGVRLHKSLFRRRYLVVLDDVWSVDAWNNIQAYFPNNENGSRIMVTTRLLDVADFFPSGNPYFMDFLDAAESWKLFCEKAFGKDGHCPPELEEVGRSITKSCRGLPLAIVVIGGLLSKSNMTREYWNFVAKDVYSFANLVDDEHCFEILSLSYHHLPIYLKPCFLYMRVFLEDSEIYGSELIRSWVAEGFLRPEMDKTLEEVAEKYLEDLIGRNLILINERTLGGKIKCCSIHDLLRDLCIRESHREYFYRVPVEQKLTLEDARMWCCNLCMESRALITSLDLTHVVVTPCSTSRAWCPVCDNCRNMYPQLNRLRWINLLDPYEYFDEDILHPTIIRSLCVSWGFKFIDKRMHMLWNLQSLIISECALVLPSEIWELPQLRHVSTQDDVALPDPPLIAQVGRKNPTIILKNLQKLSSIINFRWSDDAIKRIPNLKTLGIVYKQWGNRFIEWPSYSLDILACLKLKSLRLEAEKLVTLKNIITFPKSLRKLILSRCNIPWEEMTIIGSLPNLEVLKLYNNAFEGREWNPIEGEFPRLKLLFIFSVDLVCWGAEKSHFPNLEFLELYSMRCLEKIPLDIGEIMTLRSIHLNYCPEPVLNSAKEILEEQYNNGNEDFQLYVNRKRVFPSTD